MVASVGSSIAFASTPENSSPMDSTTRTSDSGKIQPRTGTEYYLKNVTRTDTDRTQFVEPITTYVKSPSHSYSISTSKKMTITVTGGYKKVVEAALGADFEYTKKITESSSLSANKDKMARVSMFQYYDSYKADVYKSVYSNDSPNDPIQTTKAGSTTYNQPTDVFMAIEYRDHPKQPAFE